MIPVIICGGVGTKMWPLSSPKLPKHFLPLIHGKSLFELNWETLRQKFAANEIYLQTNTEQAEIAKKLVPEIVSENVFIEPESRNQGPATGLAAALLLKKGKGDEPFFLIQVDNLRVPGENIFKMMDLAEKLGKESHKYITGGFLPDRFIKGVDFLLKGDLVDEQDGVKIFKVAEYVDRNEEEKINTNLNTDKLLVHANHTCMTPNDMLKMFQEYRPDWYEPLIKIAEGGDITSEYAKMPKGAIEEITKQVHAKGDSMVIELPFEWTDFGTWESLEKYYKANDIEPIKGEVKEVEANNNFCISNNKKKIAIIGLDNVIVVEGDDGILICRRDLSGRVGEVV
ncbi:MAG TPA: sugar phosphate nucleotidyltransferase [Spirochaetia bacterium]|nr:sugar phosphate nucleotidyltransferase [Spirochaetia bacterium]